MAMEFSHRFISSTITVALVLIVFAIVDYTYTARDESTSTWDSFDQVQVPINKQLGFEDDELFLFVQITDLHISIFSDPERYKHLQKFCAVNLAVIKPRVVLVTGDLTDAVAKNRLNTEQYEEEWIKYEKFHQECIQQNSGIEHWLDLRGNHDNFNVNGYDSPENFYPKYGVQGHRQPGSYRVVVDASNSTKYAFIALDGTLHLGSKGIFSFFGDVHNFKFDKFTEEINAVERAGVDAFFLFGHYPTSALLYSDGLRFLAAKSIAYFCGHLHTFVGLVPQMYSYHHSGMLELELADWKKERMYRIAVMDNGLFSFADVKHGEWPAIVVLNPKPALTVQPSKEPYALVRNSTHIRLLIFSTTEISSCKIKINDESWKVCNRTGKNEPLFTALWDPSNYASGLHYLKVEAKDSSGSEVLTTIQFSVDGTRPYMPFAARFVLMVNSISLGKFLFHTTIASCILLPGIPRILQRRSQQRNVTLRRTFCRGLRIVANVDFLFYPFFLYNIYLLFGPWFAARLIDSRTAIVFLWGTVFSDETLEASTSYYLGFTHLLLFNIPLLAILATLGNMRFKELVIYRRQDDRKTATFRDNFKKYYLVPCFLSVHLLIILKVVGPAFGTIAIFVNPMYTWALLLVAYLWYRALKLTQRDHQKLIEIGL